MPPHTGLASTAGGEYDRFAGVYSVWTDTAASARANLAFYVDACLAAHEQVWIVRKRETSQ